eukprot:GHVL01002091.1.p1 GENE.GHVL01002091.1~~GHVL01002091.1.p1  ORF type:complete len:135 (-),score=15.66 GHVL01002091.1:22-426(-)
MSISSETSPNMTNRVLQEHLRTGKKTYQPGAVRINRDISTPLARSANPPPISALKCPASTMNTTSDSMFAIEARAAGSPLNKATMDRLRYEGLSGRYHFNRTPPSEELERMNKRNSSRSHRFFNDTTSHNPLLC